MADLHKVTNFDVIHANQYLGLPSSGDGSGEGTEESTGRTFYVCNSTTTQEGGVLGDDSNDGLSPLMPLATISKAHSLATAARGDRAHVMPGHAETLTAVLTISKAGFNIIGHGQGTSRPQITVNYVGDGISVTGANVEIAGLYFNESTAAATANINVAAANCRIHGCRFDLGATDLESITWASGAGLEVYENEFVTTANGPDAAVEIETATDSGKFYGNIFNGGSATNAWDAAAINSVVAHTNAYIDGNVFQYGTAHITATSVSTTIGNNNIYSLGVSSPAAPHAYYTDLGTTIRDGLTPDAPTTLNDALVTKATAGDTVFVLAGSTSSPTTSQAMSVAGVKLIGLGQGRNRPAITPNGTVDIIDVTGANCLVENIVFLAATAVVTADINIGAADVTVRGCEFLAGASNTNAVITLPDAGDRALIQGNELLVTANGPTIGISIESASTDGVKILGNVFNGGSTTNQWDTAAINSSVAHTNCIIDDNKFFYGTAMVVATSVSTYVGSGNRYGIGAISTAAAPQIFYTDLGTTIRDGKSSDTPTTLNDAIVTKATAGDIVYVLAGSTSSPTTSQAMSVAGVKLIGLGNRRNRPVITPNGTVDIIDVTGANCVIENITFAAATAVVTADINIGAADCVVRNCEFLAGASNTNAVITIPDAGDRSIIEGNELLVTADGPTIGISIESASTDGVQIRGNKFNGGSTTNQWDTAAINSSVAHTNCIIDDNEFLYGTSMVVATSVSTYVGNGNKYGIGAVPNAAYPVTLYADNGTTVRDGLSPATPTTVANALTKTRTGVGDSVLLLPGTYTATAAYALSNAAVRFGPMIDNGTYNVIITTASDIDLVTLTGSNCEVFGVRFVANAAQVTDPTEIIDLDTGDWCRIHHCQFDLTSVNVVDGINVAATCTNTRIDNNYFDNCDVGDTYITDLGANTLTENNTFECPEDVEAYTNVGNTTNGQMIRYNTFNGDGGANAGMANFHTAAVANFACYGNIFAGTTSATPFGQNANWATQFAENYVASGAGGARIDPVA